MSLVYLATPYSHKDPNIRQSHPITLAGGLPLGWEYWEEYDRIILSVCSKVLVFCQNGWEKSTGVAAEIKIANELGIPVEYVDEDGHIHCL